MASLKVGQLRSILENFANALEANKADGTIIRGLRDLCAMFSGSDAKTAVAFLKATEHVAPSTNRANGPLLASVVPALTSLRTLVNKVAKKDLNNGLDSLLDALRIHADMPISVFAASMVTASERAAPSSKSKGRGNKPKSKGKEAAAPMDDRLVDDYAKRLETALGDDAKFEALLAELCADERVQQAEAVAIASRFYGRTAKGTSRPKALERIRERQDKLMKFKRQPSTAGRPAA